jgi:hypothetical protein
VVRKWATQPFGKKPVSRLSHDQMETKLVSVRKQLKNEQLKVNNLYAGLRIIAIDFR